MANLVRYLLDSNDSVLSSFFTNPNHQSLIAGINSGASSAKIAASALDLTGLQGEFADLDLSNVNPTASRASLGLTSAATGDAAGLTSGLIPPQRLGMTSGSNVFLRWTGTAWEWRTAANVRSDIGANNAGNLNAGILPDERLSSNIPLLNERNTWGKDNEFIGGVFTNTIEDRTFINYIQMSTGNLGGADGDSLNWITREFFGDWSFDNGLNASNLSGTIAAQRLGWSSGNNVFLRWTGTTWQWRTAANVRSDIGANNAGNLNAGTLPDARLSSNVPKLDGNNTWAEWNIFSREIHSRSDIRFGPSGLDGLHLGGDGRLRVSPGDYYYRYLQFDVTEASEEFTYTFPANSGTVALLDDIPDGADKANVDFSNVTPATGRSALELTSAATGDAAGLTTGTLPDARLSSNIPRLNADDTAFSGTLEVGGTLYLRDGIRMGGNPMLTSFYFNDAGRISYTPLDSYPRYLDFDTTSYDEMTYTFPPRSGEVALVAETVAQTQAISKNSLSLSGGYAVIKDDPKLRPSRSRFTIAGWVKVSSGAEAGGVLWGTGRAQSTYPANVWAVTHSTALGGILQLILNGDPSSVFYRTSNNAAPPVAYDEWMHVAFSIDTAAQEVSAFVNGMLYSTEAISNGPFNLNSTNDFMIGRGLNAGGSPIGPTFEGNIGETYFLSFAANEDDVRKLMKGDIPYSWKNGAFGGNNGIVIHLDPKNIGPAFTQWIEPNGHHALYHTTGVDSAHYLEEATLKFKFEVIMDGPEELFLGGARQIIPEGWSVASVYVRACGDNGTTWGVFYSDGSNDYLIANLSTGIEPHNWYRQAFPEASAFPGYNRLLLKFPNWSGDKGDITFKIIRRSEISPCSL